VVVKNLDHHQKKDQTHKVLQFPQRKDQQKDNQEAYFAGVIDGEGWISYEKASKPNSDYRIPCIGVEMTDEDVIRKLHSFFASGTVISMKKRVEHHKPSWRWKARGKAAVAIFFKIYNYLSGRRKEKIDEVLKRYCDDANARDKYKKLNGVLKNVVKRD
tara:strand:- start:19 stop:495 length:477 start_codon:yes stop_codon:yes gene_type:complete